MQLHTLVLIAAVGRGRALRTPRTHARYESTILRPSVQKFVGLTGAAGAVARVASAATLGWSALRIGGDAVRRVVGSARPSWRAFGSVAALWYALNAALFTTLAAADANAVPGCDGTDARFATYPLFTWLAPAAQQILFFVPATVALSRAALGRGDARNLVLHGLAGLVGMQLRELTLLGFDRLMTAHHVVSIWVAAVVWRGLGTHADPAWHACAALAVVATEAGSLGANVWGLWGRKGAYFALIAGSHVVAVAAAARGIAMHPRVPETWAAALAGAALVLQRQLYCLAEIRRGAPSGAFEDPLGTGK